MRHALLILPLLTACAAPAPTEVQESNTFPSQFVGIWSAQPDWCRFAGEIGTHDPAPIEVTSRQIHGLENSCTAASVVTVDARRVWADMQCAGEGYVYSERKHLTLADPDTLYVAREGETETRFGRCP